MMMHVYYKKGEIEDVKERQTLDPFDDIIDLKRQADEDGYFRGQTQFNIGDFAPKKKIKVKEHGKRKRGKGKDGGTIGTDEEESGDDEEARRAIEERRKEKRMTPQEIADRAHKAEA